MMLQANRSDIDQILNKLIQQGFTVYGPTLRDQAIVYDSIESTEDLPVGYTDHQEPGVYRLKKRNDSALFGYVVGPHSWKKFLQPPVQKLWEANKTDKGFDIKAEKPEPKKMAFLGVRSCELKAIGIQDKVFMNDQFTDPHYQNNRKNNFIIAVNCTLSAPTCFCASMQTGPKAEKGFDLAVTELINEKEHSFLIEAGSDQGKRLIETLSLKEAASEQVDQAEKGIEQAASSQTRKLDPVGVKDLLQKNMEHSRWEEIAKTCLSCANCTMACPTCFCTTVEDVTDLTGDHAERWRKWDSCFTMDFSFIHGGSVRPETKSRYRQWMTHKLSTWWNQFDSSGCVGCGRCITWCPVGIDITEEARIIKEGQNGNS